MSSNTANPSDQLPQQGQLDIMKTDRPAPPATQPAQTLSEQRLAKELEDNRRFRCLEEARLIASASNHTTPEWIVNCAAELYAWVASGDPSDTAAPANPANSSN